jgi:RNA polymerase sigma-70 factor (ECF subfamily)
LPEQDQQLLIQIAAGSQSAMEQLYQHFESRLYHFALNRLHDSFEAADVVNEVMLQVWRGAARFQGRSKVSTWVFGIAHNKIVDRLRKLGRARLDEIDPQQPDEDAPMLADVVAAVEASGRLRECIERLSDAHRQVVHLAFFEDLPYPEIAEILACPQGTVKTRMFHARRQLKQCLQQGGI